MTVYQFDTQVACEYGLNEAIFLWNLQFWIRVNKANKINFHDERTWSFNSIAAYEELFPFFSLKQIRCLIDRLVDANILIKGNYNKSAYDRTSWLAFVNEEKWCPNVKCICPLGQMGSDKRANGLGKKGEPIPDSKPDKKTYKKDNVPSAIASGLASDLLSAILKTKPDLKKPNLEKWAQEIDRMLDIDKISIERIKKVIEYLPSLDFWKGNILSADKLRKQIDKLEIAIQGLGEKKEKQQLAINRETNKAWVMQMIAQYPEGLKNVKFSGWMVQNPFNSKDVSLNMIPDRFQEVFASVFGGEKDGV